MALAPGDKHEQLEYMLDACESEGRGLTDWENNFIESIRDQFDRNGYLSEKQIEILERIYCEKV